MREALAQPLSTGGRRLPRLFLRAIKNAKRMIVGVIGITILATEFARAHSLLSNLKNRAIRLKKGSTCPSNP